MQVPWVRGFLGVQSTNVCAAVDSMSWLPQEGGAPSFAQRAFLEKALTTEWRSCVGFWAEWEKNNDNRLQFRFDQEDQYNHIIICIAIHFEQILGEQAH